MPPRDTPDEETSDWRAVCGRTASTVRRAGRATFPTPIDREQEDDDGEQEDDDGEQEDDDGEQEDDDGEQEDDDGQQNAPPARLNLMLMRPERAMTGRKRNGPVEPGHDASAMAGRQTAAGYRE
jgi:hypothetical protein